MLCDSKMEFVELTLITNLKPIIINLDLIFIGKKLVRLVIIVSSASEMRLFRICRTDIKTTFSCEKSVDFQNIYVFLHPTVYYDIKLTP